MIYLALLKRFWPFLAGAVLLLIVWRWHVSAVKDAYQEGVADTEDKQAEVIAVRMLENEKRERELALLVQAKQLELEVKDNANRVLADDIKRLAGESRLCLADKVRRSTVPEATSAAGSSNGATGSNGPAETLGSAATTIFADCQRSVDKLLVMQAHEREVQAKFQ